MQDIVPSDSPQDKPHYTYALCYPDDYPDEQKAGMIFYIGKGLGNRMYVHEILAKQGKGPNPHKRNVIRKIWANGGQVVKKILACFETHEEACMHEIALIFFMGDRITNLTHGGEGAWGQVKSAETRRKHRENARKQMASPEARQHLREINIGKRHSAETRRKISEINKLRPPASEETRQKLREAIKRQPPEYRQKLSESQKRSPQAAERLRKLHEFNRGKKRSPEVGQKISTAKKAGYQAKRESRTYPPIIWPSDPLSAPLCGDICQLSLDWNA